MNEKTVTVISAHEGAATWVSVCRFIDESANYRVRSFHQYEDLQYRSIRTVWARLLHRFRTYVIFPLRFLFCARHISRKSDVLVVVTSPFFMPILAACVISRKKKIIALMYDIYPEALITKGLIKRNGKVENFIKWCYNHAFKKIDSVVFISAQHKFFVTKDIWLPPRSRVIPISGNTDPFVELAPTLVQGSKNILYCGTLGLMHETDTFLNWYGSHTGRGDITFSFYTSGALKQKFERQVKELINARVPLNRVIFGDSLPEFEWANLMKRNQIGLVFQDVGSGNVIFPSKIASILAAGQAVIAVADIDSDIAKLIVNNNCGWVVAPGDTYGFNQCIESLNKTEELLIKRTNAFKIGHSIFGKNAVAREWMDLFDSIMNSEYD